MPPEIFTSPNFQTGYPIFPRLVPNSSNSHKNRQLKRMEVNLTSKRFIHILVFILAFMSIFRLLRFAITSYSSSPQLGSADFVNPCNSSESRCQEIITRSMAYSVSPKSKPITKKEFQFLSDIITKRRPCNLLIFGWEPQYRRLAKINSQGLTVVLEENPERIKLLRRSNTTKIYKVNYDIMAKEAYKLLKYARREVACAPNFGNLRTLTCKLALKNLSNEVYETKWDVILVDGPSSDGPEAFGRMKVIYTSSMLARVGNFTTHVVVHDVDRTIEKWFSREFLCEENLVSTKGRYWNFRIKGGKQWYSTSFCSQDHNRINF